MVTRSSRVANRAIVAWLLMAGVALAQEPVTTARNGKSAGERPATEVAQVIKVGNEIEGEMGASQIYGMCSPCHGLNGRGGGIVASVKDSKLTDEQFVKVVLQGRPGTPMRPYKGLLSEKQILAVRAHIMNLPN